MRWCLVSSHLKQGDEKKGKERKGKKDIQEWQTIEEDKKGRRGTKRRGREGRGDQKGKREREEKRRERKKEGKKEERRGKRKEEREKERGEGRREKKREGEREERGKRMRRYEGVIWWVTIGMVIGMGGGEVEGGKEWVDIAVKGRGGGRGVPKPEICYYEQEVDHFAYKNEDKFKQRYLKNEENVKGKGKGRREREEREKKERREREEREKRERREREEREREREERERGGKKE